MVHAEPKPHPQKIVIGAGPSATAATFLAIVGLTTRSLPAPPAPRRHGRLRASDRAASALAARSPGAAAAHRDGGQHRDPKSASPPGERGSGMPSIPYTEHGPEPTTANKYTTLLNQRSGIIIVPPPWVAQLWSTWGQICSVSSRICSMTCQVWQISASIWPKPGQSWSTSCRIWPIMN